MSQRILGAIALVTSVLLFGVGFCEIVYGSGGGGMGPDAANGFYVLFVMALWLLAYAPAPVMALVALYSIIFVDEKQRWPHWSCAVIVVWGLAIGGTRGIMIYAPIAQVTRWKDAGAEIVVNSGKLRAARFWTFNDAGRALLKTGEARDLMSISLYRTGVSDADLRDLARLPELHGVVLSETKVTDAGVAELCRSEALDELYLDHTPVTDACLAALARAPKLRTVHLDDTAISDEGIAWLREQKPGMTVNKWRPAPFRIKQ